MSNGEWKTPLGSVPVDSDLANFLKQKFSFLAEDIDAHRAGTLRKYNFPFCKFMTISFVPIALGTGAVRNSGSTGIGNR